MVWGNFWLVHFDTRLSDDIYQFCTISHQISILLVATTSILILRIIVQQWEFRPRSGAWQRRCSNWLVLKSPCRHRRINMAGFQQNGANALCPCVGARFQQRIVDSLPGRLLLSVEPCRHTLERSRSRSANVSLRRIVIVGSDEEFSWRTCSPPFCRKRVGASPRASPPAKRMRDEGLRQKPGDGCHEFWPRKMRRAFAAARRFRENRRSGDCGRRGIVGGAGSPRDPPNAAMAAGSAGRRRLVVRSSSKATPSWRARRSCCWRSSAARIPSLPAAWPRTSSRTSFRKGAGRCIPAARSRSAAA